MSALASARVHVRLGIIATSAAALVAISTLLTKQHYVLDVVAGVALALVAYAVFLRGYPSHQTPECDRHAAPALALCVGALVAVGVLIFWLVYLWGAGTQLASGP